jgi:hypothetical protein
MEATFALERAIPLAAIKQAKAADRSLLRQRAP